MGIRGASGLVECFDPFLQERVDRARPIQGAWARLSSSTLVSEILEANGQVRDPQPRNIRCGECIPPRECRMVLSWLGSHSCGLCLSRLISGLQPEWVQVYNPCRVKTIYIAADSVTYNS